MILSTASAANTPTRALRIALAAAFAAAALSVAAATVPQPAQAQAASSHDVFSYSSFQQGKKASKAVGGYDVTGDGKADTLRFTVNNSNPSKPRFKIAVNGQSAYTSDGKRCGCYLASAEVLQLANGRTLIYATYTGDNADGTYHILQYRAGKLAVALSEEQANGIRHPWIAKVSPVGSKVKVTYANSPFATSYIEYTYTYKVRKASLKRTSSTAKVAKVGFTNHSTVTCAKKLSCHKHPSAGSGKVTLKKGAKVSITAVKTSGRTLWFKLEPKSGGSCWLANPGRYMMNTPGGTYFKELYQAG